MKFKIGDVVCVKNGSGMPRTIFDININQKAYGTESGWWMEEDLIYYEEHKKNFLKNNPSKKDTQK